MLSTLVNLGGILLLEEFVSVSKNTDKKLNDHPMALILGTTVIVTLAIQALYRKTLPRWGETRLEQFGRICLFSDYAKRKFNSDIDREYSRIQKSIQDKWKLYGEPILELPEKGWSSKQIIELINSYIAMTEGGINHLQLSGTIYSNSLCRGKGPAFIIGDLPEVDENDLERAYSSQLSHKLNTLFTEVSRATNLWNPLHEEFGIGSFIEYQVVRMVASMYGGDPSEVMGFVTSGGTESLMLAMRIYRNWGIETKGHRPGQGVVIAGKSVHAAILKAKMAYFINVILIDVDEEGNIDLKELKRQAKKHKDDLIAIVGSAPSYATGIEDDIKALAEIAEEMHCGLHVDSCLGGFIINNLLETDYLKIPGVTSLSADPHKNGQAPKGVSCLVTKQLDDKNLAFYSIYSHPDWDGGVYGTHKNEGSQSCTPALNAFIAMLGTGQSGYMRIANAIYSGAKEFAEIIKSFKGKLKLLAEPEVNVIAFKVDPEWGLEKGATYALAYEMKKRGFVLNTMQNDRVHFCMTLRYVCNSEASFNLKNALEASLDAVENLNAQLLAEGKTFPGDAGMYCALDNALKPQSKTLSFQKYVENMLLGALGAVTAVKANFYILMDPYIPSPFKD